MSDKLADVAFINAVSHLQKSFEAIANKRPNGYSILNAIRNYLHSYYPMMVMNLTVDLRTHENIFESLFQMLIDGKVMLLLPDNAEPPAESRTGSRLIQHLHGTGKSILISMDSNLQIMICNEFKNVTRSAFIELASNPCDYDKIKFSLEMSIFKILNVLYDTWNNKSSILNNAVVQNISGEVLSEARNKITASYKILIQAYQSSIDKQASAPAELVSLIANRIKSLGPVQVQQNPTHEGQEDDVDEIDDGAELASQVITPKPNQRMVMPDAQNSAGQTIMQRLTTKHSLNKPVMTSYDDE